MGKPKLTLFIDVLSPFGYIAFHVVNNSQAFKQCDITYVPILLGGIMKALDNKPPLDIKNKKEWIEKERLRWRAYFNIPMTENRPEPFPQPTITAQRALCAIEINHPEKLPAAYAALCHALWVEGKTVNKPDVIAPALQKVFSEEEVKTIMRQAGEAEAKKRLNDNGAKALESGAFGLPWFVAENTEGKVETFWGVDHLGQVLEHLGLDRKKEEGFRSLL